MKNISLITLVLLSACASLPKVSAQGEKVKVSKEAPAKNCKEVGQVFGSANSNAYRSDQAAETVEAARNDLRNKAADKGANYLVLETNNSAPYGSSGGTTTTMGGTAYKCP